MYRRYPMAMLVLVALTVATFVNEPGATVRFTGDVFVALGELGGSVVSELAADDT